MLLRALYALGVGIVTIIVCLLLGALLQAFSQETLTSIGTFLEHYAGLIGLLAGLAYFLFGWQHPNPRV